MIDESILFKELQRIEKPLFDEYQKAIVRAQWLWSDSVSGGLSYETARAGGVQLSICWTGDLGAKYFIEPCNTYQVIGIDGSQVYPDRHEGMRVALINIGGLWFSYDKCSQVNFFCQPQILIPESESDTSAVALVDAQRHEQELALGVEKSIFYAHPSGSPLCVLFDGALIFWHLENREDICARYFARYCAYIQQLCEQKILCAWYTSLPKGRDLVRTLSAYIGAQQDTSCLKKCSDGDLVDSWLGVHQRTGVFEVTSVFAQKYPKNIRPYFFYINSGVEIARVEIPAYLAQDQAAVNIIAALVIDQCKKGDGYPVSLAEAHAHVVVKQPDRLLFQKLVCHFADQHQTSISISRKLMKKRSLAL